MTYLNIIFCMFINILLQVPLVILMAIYVVWHFKAVRGNLSKVNRMLNMNIVRILLICFCLVLEAVTLFMRVFVVPDSVDLSIFSLALLTVHTLIIVHDITECVRWKTEKLKAEGVE